MRIIGHRGTPTCAAHPENTLPAIRSALEAGADGVEVDVRATADGVLVLAHDPDLGRVLGTGPGTGPVVAGTSWSSLRALTLPGGTRVPRLSEALDLATRYGAHVVTEVKTDPWPRRLRSAVLLSALLLLRRQTRAATDRVTTSSFDADAARLLGGAGAVGSAVILPSSVEPRPLALAARADGLTELHLQVDHLVRDPDLVRHLHGLGLGVAAGTDDPATARWCHDLGVDLLCTDRPDLLAAARAPSALVVPRPPRQPAPAVPA